jgi:hypothetical protein
MGKDSMPKPKGWNIVDIKKILGHSFSYEVIIYFHMFHSVMENRIEG